MTPKEQAKAAKDAKEAAEKAEREGRAEEAATYRELYEALSKPTEHWQEPTAKE